MKTSEAMTHIVNALNGKVDLSEIKATGFVLPCEQGESLNHLLFIGYKFGIYFYTDKSDLEGLCYLKEGRFPTYVCCKESRTLFEIK